METVNISLERFKKLEKDSHTLKVMTSKDVKILHIRSQLPLIEEFNKIIESSMNYYNYHRYEYKQLRDLYFQAKTLKQKITSPDPKDFNEIVLIDYTSPEVKELTKKFFEEEKEKLSNQLKEAKELMEKELDSEKTIVLNKKCELQKQALNELAQFSNPEEILSFYQNGQKKLFDMEAQKESLIKELGEKTEMIKSLRASQKELGELKAENAKLKSDKVYLSTKIYALKNRNFFRRLFNI